MREQQDEAGLSLGQARRLIEAIRKIKSQKQRPSLSASAMPWALGQMRWSVSWSRQLPRALSSSRGCACPWGERWLNFPPIVKFVRQALRLDPGVRLRLAVKRAVTAGRLVRVGRLYRLPGSESDESESDSDDELDASDRLGVGKNGDIAGRTGHKAHGSTTR
ncbi:hypothetical protein HPB52_025101 [Rhipicephalus sanguineus]|uniref:H15 domain-containing protein n=1 Tax=Rhipicephalus sanguineus TaxID=34632 RepID=A0A9D4TDG0_RHISA|nr:hypothetical protein HPB52_025101 [Rhipicephalus sanguineus]